MFVKLKFGEMMQKHFETTEELKKKKDSIDIKILKLKAKLATDKYQKKIYLLQVKKMEIDL